MEPNEKTPAASTNENELMDKLNAATEKKEPTTNTSTWNFDVDEKDLGQVVNDDNFTKTETPKTEISTASKTEIKDPKIVKDFRMASARIAVSAIDSTQRMIFCYKISKKYEKKFTEKEVEKLSESNIIDAEKSKLNEEDLPLRNKFDRLMDKRDKKLNKVPFDPTESSDLEKMLYQYMDAKNVDLPPEISLLIGFANVLGKRAIDLGTD